MMAPNYALYAPGAWAVLDPSMAKRTFDGDAAMSGTKRAAPPNYHMRNMHAERQERQHERLAAYNMQALTDALPPLPVVAEPSPMLQWLQEAENERQQRRRQDAERQWVWREQGGKQEQQRQQQQALLLEAEAARRQRREERERSEGSAWVCASGFVRVN